MTQRATNIVMVWTLVSATVLAGQEADSLALEPDTAAVVVDSTAGGVDSVAVELQPSAEAASFLTAPEQSSGVGPGGAFWRSLLIPGWGHAVVGAHSRGAFYFTAAVGISFMIFKSVSNRDAAERVRDGRALFAAESLRQSGTPEDSIPILVLENPAVLEAQELADTRSQQVQDWIAAGAFLLLINGADAFVSAHLIDFPEPLQFQVLPAGRVEVGVSIPARGPGG